MKLARLIDDRFHTALAKLSDELLPLRTTFKLKGIAKVVREEFTKYEEVRKSALQKYGVKNEDGSLKTDDKNNVQFDEDGIKAFITEINELAALEVEVPTLKVSELGDKVRMTVDDLLQLEDVIVED